MHERLLVVISDDLHFVHFAEDILPDYGFRIAAISKGNVEAVAALDSRPQVVFFDGGLAADNDELAVAQRLRQHPEISTVPLVISSGSRDVPVEKRSELMNLGCVVLEKPFNLTQLIEAIEQAALQGARG